MKNFKLALALLISLGVSACGGGGGNGSGNTAPSTPLDITANNKLIVTTATLNTMSGGAVSAFSPDEFLKAFNNVPCVNGGSVNSFPSGSTAGTLRFSNCGFVANKSYNGTVTFSNLTTAPANSLNPTDAAVSLNFNLTVNRTGFSPLTLLGDYHLNATGLSSPSTNTTITGTSLKLSSSITEEISNFTFSSVLLTNFSSTDTNNFSLASSLLGGKISCQTTTPFVTNIALNSRFPSAGVAIVTSTLNSNKLRITILGDETSANQVQVELDTGIGYGSPVLYTWAQLFP